MSNQEAEMPIPCLSYSNTDATRNPIRHITSHDSSGRSILIPNTDLFYRSAAGGAISWAYAVPTVPVSISNDSDLSSYLSKDGEKHSTSHNLAGLQTTVPGGVNVSYLDLAPGAETPMHRTISVDITVVVEGELEMELDSGEKVLLKAGDSVVQRATMHKWKNASRDKIVRVIGVLLACEQIEVKGKPIEEEWLQE